MYENTTIPRILIIDDNEDIHKDFRSVLQPSGQLDPTVAEDEAILFDTEAPIAAKRYEIDSAYQGVEGIERVRAARADGRPYALAFVDVRMPPGIDGIETTKRIWDKDPSIQIVICTAYSDHSWQDIARQLGETDRLLVMKKPFESIEARQIAIALTEKWKLIESLDQKVQVRTSDLQQHQRQLQYLYFLSDLIQTADTTCVEESLQNMVNRIPEAFQNMGSVQATLTIENQSVTSPQLSTPAPSYLTRDICVQGKVVGAIEIYSPQNSLPAEAECDVNDTCFIKTVAEQIGRFLEIHYTHRFLQNMNTQLQTLLDTLSAAHGENMGHENSAGPADTDPLSQLRCRVECLLKFSDTFSLYP